MLFSQRKGYKPMQKAFQREKADNELRNQLWSILELVIWRKWEVKTPQGWLTADAKLIDDLLDIVWISFFKLSVDERPEFKNQRRERGEYQSMHAFLRQFFFEANWYEMFDLIEFILVRVPREWQEELVEMFNIALERENSAYRIIGERVAEITTEMEVETIEDALQNSIDPIQEHLQRALDLLSDRANPDYRNSIKESISAVEATLNSLTGSKNKSLGAALKELERSQILIIPSVLKEGFSKLYGFASSSGGIRHGLTSEDYQPTFSDAKFMLVACSAFVNYLRMKADNL